MTPGTTGPRTGEPEGEGHEGKRTGKCPALDSMVLAHPKRRQGVGKINVFDLAALQV